MASIESVAKAQALASAIKAMTGIEPSVAVYPTYSAILWTPDKAAALRAWIETQSKKAPGSVRIEYGPVVTPLILQRGIPIVAAALALGYLVGKAL